MVGAAVLGMTWLGYPAAVYVLSLFFPRPRRAADLDSTVSIILATRDAPKMIRRRVRDLLRSTYPSDRREVVVALDSGSRWACEDLAELRKGDAVRLVKSTAPPGKASTLNVAVEYSHGELLIFADTSQRFSPDAVSELVSAFSDPSIGGASGRLVLRRLKRSLSPAHTYWTVERWLRKREARIHSPV